MTCNKCLWANRPQVTLHDGRQVCDCCEDWRHECEARAIVNMPTLAQRRAYLYGRYEDAFKHGKPVRRLAERGILQIRGQGEVTRLEATMRELWAKRGKTGDDAA